MQRLINIHRETVIQFAKFGTVGAVGFFVDLGLFYFALYVLDFESLDQESIEILGFNIWGLGHIASGLFSFPFTVTLTWLGNRLFTFRGRNSGSIGAQWKRFLAVCLVGLVLNRGTFSLLSATVPLVYKYPVLGLLAGTGAGMFFNFFFSRKLVFRSG